MEREATIEQPLVTLVPRVFEDFYRGTYPQLVRALVLALGDRELGREAADEAMARTYQRWQTVHSYNNPEGWVYRVGLNWGRSFLRRVRRERVGVFADVAEHADSAADPALDRALAALPAKQRSVVVARYYLDWSTEEIAAALRIPQGTVKSRLHRALEALEGPLGDKELP
jgi:RNA polymerase sigma-70 factor (ECF subfamily)